MKINKLFYSIILLLTITLTNCSFYDKVNKDPGYSSVSDYPITSIITKDSTQLKFNDNCGRVINAYNSVYGKTIDSNYVLLHVEQIKEFRILDQMQHTCEELSKYKIYELVLNNGRLITFNSNFGSFNSNNKMITGISNEDNDISVHADQVAFFYSEPASILPYENVTEETKLTSIVLKENNLIFVFDNNKGSYFKIHPIVWGYDLNDRVIIKKLNDLQSLKIKRFNYLMTTLGNIGLGLAIIIIPLLLIAWALGPIRMG